MATTARTAKGGAPYTPKDELGELQGKIAVQRLSTMFEVDTPGEALHRIGKWWDSSPVGDVGEVDETFVFYADEAKFTVLIENAADVIERGGSEL